MYLADSNFQSPMSPQALLRCFIDSNLLIHLHDGYQFQLKVCKPPGGSSPQSTFYAPNHPRLSVSEHQLSDQRCDGLESGQIGFHGPAIKGTYSLFSKEICHFGKITDNSLVIHLQCQEAKRTDWTRNSHALQRHSIAIWNSIIILSNLSSFIDGCF